LQCRIKEKKYYENDEHIIMFAIDDGQMLVTIVIYKSQTFLNLGGVLGCSEGSPFLLKYLVKLRISEKAKV
jgi:hypothetical protein